MASMREYSDLIRLIPASKQSAMIKKDVWERFSYNGGIKKAIFGSDEIVKISRADVLSERDVAKRIVMTLMWVIHREGVGKT